MFNDYLHIFLRCTSENLASWKDATKEERAEYYRNSFNEFNALVESVRPVSVGCFVILKSFM